MLVERFTASWCGPCKVFGPRFDDDMARLGVEFNVIDVDTEEGKEKVAAYHLQSVPAVAIDGKLITPYGDYLNKISEAINS